MKYNEKNLTDMFKNEEDIWDTDDLDWFDSELAYKLQHDELSEQEKYTLIDMMANDQAVMNRYLQLKQHTMPVKESLIDMFLNTLKTHKMIPLLATSFALLIALVVIIKQSNEGNNFDSELVRGLPQVSIYPAENSIIKDAPEYFIVDNIQTQKIRLHLTIDNAVMWISDFQQSNKFYMPIQIQQKLTPGRYSWTITDKNDKTITKNSFTVN